MEQESGHIDGQRGIVGRFHLFGLVDVIRYDQSESDQPVTLVPRLRELLLHLNITSVALPFILNVCMSPIDNCKLQWPILEPSCSQWRLWWAYRVLAKPEKMSITKRLLRT